MIKIYKDKMLRNMLIFAVILSMLAAFAPQPVRADQFEDELAKIIAEKDKAAAKTAALQQKVDELKLDEIELVEAKLAIEERNSMVLEQIKLIVRQLKVYNSMVEAKEEEVTAAQEEEDNQLAKYRARVRAMEEGGRVDLFDLIFNSRNLSQLLSAFDDYSEIMKNDRLIYDELQEARANLESARKELENTIEKVELKKLELEDESDKLYEEIAASEKMLEELTEELLQAEEELLAAQVAEDRAAEAITDFLREYYRQKEEEERRKAEEEEERRKAEEEAGGNYGDDIFVPMPVTPAPNAPQPTPAPQPPQQEQNPSGGGDFTPDISDPSEPSSPSGGEGDSGFVPDFPIEGGTDSGSGDSGFTPDFPTGGEGDSGFTPDFPSGGDSGNNSGSGSGSTDFVPDFTEPGVGTGSFVWPFPGKYSISSPYGYRQSTGTFHSGIDIDGYKSLGMSIVAADSGTVIMSSYYGAMGNTIMIDHGNGYVTVYGHLNSLEVSTGSYVAKGQRIGGVGNTGRVYGEDGIHLHFEVRINGETVNPSSYV